MNLAQAIHARWAADARLDALLPVARVMTGTCFAADPGTRFATITLPGGTFEGYANDGSSLSTVLVRIQVHHDDYDGGQAVTEAVLAAFGRAELSLSAGGKVLCMQPAAVPQEVQDPENGQWDWLIDFQCRVHLPAGE